VIEQALLLNRPDATRPLDVLAKLGGLEIAGLVGLVLGAVQARIPVVVDGFIATAAALVAVELCPPARSYLIAAHRSVEVGHQAALQRLELEPLFALDLRLGEGTGAVLALPMLDKEQAPCSPYPCSMLHSPCSTRWRPLMKRAWQHLLMRTVLVIGIGAGDPDQVTIQAIKAMNRVELADLVSEVQPVKHPFQRGIKAQRGIEF